MLKIFAVTALIVISAPTLCVPQSQAPSPLLRSNAVPDRALYWAMFRHIVHLQTVAASLGAAGQPEKQNDLLSYYQRKAALTAVEDSLLKQMARECADQVQQNDNKAKALIQSIRSRFPGGKLPDRASLPAIPSELLAMQQERNKIIDDHIAKLQSVFGDSEFHRLDRFVKMHIAPQVSSVPMIPAHPELMRPSNSLNGVSR